MIDPASDGAMIEAILHLYGRGVHFGDPKALCEVLHPQATIAGYRDGHLVLATRDEFIDGILDLPVPHVQGEAYEKKIDRAKIAGDAAMASMRELYQGLVYTNFFTLLHIDNRWWIMSNTFHCEPRLEPSI